MTEKYSSFCFKTSVWHFSFALLTFSSFTVSSALLLWHLTTAWSESGKRCRNDRMNFMTKRRWKRRRKMNDMYATWSEYRSLIRITQNLQKKELLITSQQHPFAGASEPNKTAEFHLPPQRSEVDGKAFSLNFYYTIRDRFHIWFYCDPF